MNVFYSMWQLENIILLRVYRCRDIFINHHVVVFFETNVLKEIHIERSPYKFVFTTILQGYYQRSKIKLYIVLDKFS